ncbi:MAG: hypothetical protein J2P36_35125 [Ktedonobacteraceae bacterium]|nr:hypothetical protein [Ktedonobacteraceae bacterium]
MASETPRTRNNRRTLSVGLLLFALLGFVVGTAGYILSARNYSSHNAFLVHNGQPLKVTTARGENITLALQINDGISGYWASDQGLELRLDGVDTPLLVVGPKEQTWGSTITTSSKDTGEFTVAGSVTLPSSISGPETRPLSGTLSGRIVYPSGGILFQDKVLDISVPIQIQLIPQGSQLWSGGRLLFDIFAGLDLLCGALLLLLAVWPLLRAIFGKRGTRESSAPRDSWQQFKDWLWALGGGLFLAAVCTLLLVGLFAGLTSAGISTPAPDDVRGLNLLMPGIVGLSVLLGLVGAMLKDESQKRTQAR